jgi:hypothetical protein
MSKLIAPLALVGALALGVSACGSSSSTTTTSSAAASGAGATSSSARYQARLSLAKCFRSHGLNVPDPKPNGGVPGGGDALRNIQSQPNYRAASQACAKYMKQAFPVLSLSPAQRAQFQKGAVKFAECMRAHGIDIPDPTSQPGGGFGIRRAIPQSERNSPAFQSALQACVSNLPFRPGSAPGA